MTRSVLEGLDRILGQRADADDVLRRVVHALSAEPGVSWAGIAFLDDGRLAPGPEAGVRGEGSLIRVAIEYRGRLVGELSVEGEADPRVLERVAASISEYVLIGWDTRGEPWEP